MHQSSSKNKEGIEQIDQSLPSTIHNPSFNHKHLHTSIDTLSASKLCPLSSFDFAQSETAQTVMDLSPFDIPHIVDAIVCSLTIAELY